MAKMLMISADKCTGCHNCELACSMTHEDVFRPDCDPGACLQLGT